MGVQLQLGVVSGRRHERAGLDEVVQQCLGQGGSFGRVRARAEFIEQDQLVGPARFDDPDDGAHVTAERGKRLSNGLLVAYVGVDIVEDRQPRATVRRDVQPRLVHQAKQPQRPQRDGLAAGIRPSDEERRVVAAQPNVHRDDVPGESRMARAQQNDLGPVCNLGRDGIHLFREACFGVPKVEARQRLKRLSQRGGLGGNDGRKLVEDALDFSAFSELGFTPGIAHLDGHERFHEERLAAA